MHDFLHTYGRALDISGAFAFTGLFFGCLIWGYNVFALAFAMGAIAFVSSWQFWAAYDWSEGQFHQTMTLVFALISAALFLVAIINKVMA